MKAHQITIKDIAKQLNISKSTVSRVLTGNHNVKEETRQKVLEFASKVDYQKNLFASNLATQKINQIGIIVPEFMSSYFPKVIVGAQNKITAERYNLIIAQSNESYETEVANAKAMMANRLMDYWFRLQKKPVILNIFWPLKEKEFQLCSLT